MPTVAVLDMNGKEVEKIDLSEAIFGIEPNKSVMLHMVKNYLANQRQGTQSADTRRGFRRRQKAVAPEGDRPRKTGLHPRSPVDARRHCLCAEAARLQLYREQEGSPAGNEVRIFQQGAGQ